MRFFGLSIGDAVVAAAIVAIVSGNPPPYAASAFASVASAMHCAATGTCGDLSSSGTATDGASDILGNGAVRIGDDSTGRGQNRNGRDGGGRRGLFKKCGRRLRLFGLRYRCDVNDVAT